MNADLDYEQIGRFIYSAHRAGFQLSLLMDRMGKSLAPMQPGEKMNLAEDAAEADALFARLPTSAELKAEFSVLMQSLKLIAERLDRVAALTAEEVAAGTAATSAALQDLPRYRAMIDDLPGTGAR
jgi:hypothetical protein